MRETSPKPEGRGREGNGRGGNPSSQEQSRTNLERMLFEEQRKAGSSRDSSRNLSHGNERPQQARADAIKLSKEQNPARLSLDRELKMDMLRAIRESPRKIREDFSTVQGDTVRNQRKASEIAERDFFKNLYQKATQEQQYLYQLKGNVASQKLDRISPSMYQTYKWQLQQKDQKLRGEELEKAIWQLHEYRQKEGFYPEKTVVAPDKSETQTLVDQISHGSSSDTLLLQDEVLTKQNREELRESFRSLVQEYRQEGNVRSTSPTFRNMTEGQILLEALSHSDCLDRLQDKGIQVNNPTLEFIRHMLTEMQMKSPMPSDYNPAVEKFNEAARKFESKDVAAPHVEPVRLEGGAYIMYHQASQSYFGRTMTLKDPDGQPHVFNKGQSDSTIADYTDQAITFYSNHHGTKKAREYVNYYQLDPQLIPQYAEHYKAEYNKGQALTEADVMALREGNSLKGWKCTQQKFTRLKKHVYYTDKGTPIPALDLSLYEPYTIKEHEASIPHPPIDKPTPRFNCLSEFIERKFWLYADSAGNQVQKILDDNGYYRKDPEIDDIVIWRKNGNITHMAKVIAKDSHGTRVDSKPGDWGLTRPYINDPWSKEEFGEPETYHTDRGSHLLRTTYP